MSRRGDRAAGPRLPESVEALAAASRAGAGRLPDDLVHAVDGVVAHVRERLAMAPDTTVVALAGATGSGKSSLANALTGVHVAEPGVRRPTTGQPIAAVWPAPGGQGPGADDVHTLLSWLDVRQRVDVPADQGGALDAGLVVLDLPDHDSVETSHREIAERLYERVDLLVWVLDPQKYADAALHVRYLRPLAGHAEVMVLVLNHADRLSADEQETCVTDLRRLAEQDGLGAVPVLAASARTGQGVAQLRALLAEAAARRQASTARLRADVTAAAHRVLDELGPAPASPSSRPPGTGALVDACAEAAGVPVVVDAVRGAAARQGRAATGWPPVRWWHRWRPDPLRRLHLRAGAPRDPATVRTGVHLAPVDRPAPGSAGPVGRARISSALRDHVRAAMDGAPVAWVDAARDATDLDGLPDALDQAVAGTPLLPERRPVWWRVAGAAQWLLLAAALIGLGWLGLLALLGYLRLPEPPTPRWGEVPVPTALALGGLLLGVLLAVLASVLAGWGARRRAVAAQRRLRSSVAAVVHERLVAPVAAEADRWASCRASAEAAAGGGRSSTRSPGPPATRPIHDPEGVR